MLCLFFCGYAISYVLRGVLELMILVTRYAMDICPREGITRMFNVVTKSYYVWIGGKWVRQRSLNLEFAFMADIKRRNVQ